MKWSGQHPVGHVCVPRFPVSVTSFSSSFCVWSDNTLRSVSSVRLSAKPLSHCIFLFHSPLCCLSLRTLWLLAVLLSLSRISDLVYSNASTGLRVLWTFADCLCVSPKAWVSSRWNFHTGRCWDPLGDQVTYPKGRAEQRLTGGSVCIGWVRKGPVCDQHSPHGRLFDLCLWRQ